MKSSSAEATRLIPLLVFVILLALLATVLGGCRFTGDVTVTDDAERAARMDREHAQERMHAGDGLAEAAELRETISQASRLAEMLQAEAGGIAPPDHATIDGYAGPLVVGRSIPVPGDTSAPEPTAEPSPRPTWTDLGLGVFAGGAAVALAGMVASWRRSTRALRDAVQP